MTTSLKDVSSAQMIHALSEMNCFETECTIYGYVWKDRSGRKKYTTSEDYYIIHQSFEEKELLGYAMSPIKQLSARLILKDETKDDIVFLQKLKLSKLLQEYYDNEYFKVMDVLSSVENDNQADEMLRAWQAEIEGYYDVDAVLLFEGVVIEAYRKKHLTQSSYNRYVRWIQQTRKQISKQGHRLDKFSRTFFGVAYEKKDDTYGFLCNANKQSLFERLQEFDEKDVFYTPVFSREYTYHKSNELKDVRKAFEEHLRISMDREYLELLRTINKLPFQSAKIKIEECLKQAKMKCTQESLNGVLFWAHRWNMI